MDFLARTWVFHVMATAVTLSGCSSDNSSSCEYQMNHSLGALPVFSLSVTLPDGMIQSCSDYSSPSDGGVTSSSPGLLGGQVTGWITETAATTFTLDQCVVETGCSPTVYRFAANAPGLTLTLPLSRQVTVAWQFSLTTLACTQGLVIIDGSTTNAGIPGSPYIWLAGADSTLAVPAPIPFTVLPQALYCNPSPGLDQGCGGTNLPPDDYALVFQPTSSDPTLILHTGMSGTLILTAAPGVVQHMVVRNLRSYQTTRCDDNWNWGWWAAGQVNTSGQLE